MRLVPLGSWCRAAYQCRLQAETLGLSKTISTPFDWSITPFRSLMLILEYINNPDLLSNELILNPSNCCINPVGSVKDVYTGISYHHDLGPDIVKSFHGIDYPMPSNKINKHLANSKEWEKARGRFEHTLNNFWTVFSDPYNIFVRWQRLGVDNSVNDFPNVFEGESSERILKALQRAGMHQNSMLITVETKVLHGEKEVIKSPILDFRQHESGQLIHCILAERKGLNGDQTWNFRGDEKSWEHVVRKCIKHTIRES